MILGEIKFVGSMSAKVSLLVKHLLPVVCAFLVVSITILSSGDSINDNILSPQPATFEQMEKLVMPQDQAVAQTLSQVLGTDSTSSSGSTSSAVADINRIRLWVFSNVSEASDYALHRVNDYWQTPVETLTLKAGDCEDFAILMVSLMRAYGVPKDQVYVAVGYDPNKGCHAFVVERYCYGAWTEFDPENLNDAVLLDGSEPMPYDISYCFNDQVGFNGTPVYPPGYIVPPVSVIPVVPTAPAAIYIYNIKSKNSSLDEIKQHLGELWLPTFLPLGYTFYFGAAYYSQEIWSLELGFQTETGSQLLVEETPGVETMQVSSFPFGTVEQVTVNNQTAYLVNYTYAFGNGTSTVFKTALMLLFNQGSLAIRLAVTPADSLAEEQLIKIAESLVEY